MGSISLDERVAPERLEALARALPWPAERPKVPLPAAHLGRLDGGTRALLAEELSGETRLVVELGAWLGLTTRFLADGAPKAVVAAIDHWLGSPEHRARPEWAALLPTLHEAFLALCWPYRGRVVPMRMTTLAGLHLLGDYGLAPDLIYVDAEHSYEAVLSELELSARLFPRAALVGNGHPLGPVRAAVEEFAGRRGLGVRTAGSGWKVARPGEGGRK
jgi:hypothetical protein